MVLKFSRIPIRPFNNAGIAKKFATKLSNEKKKHYLPFTTISEILKIDLKIFERCNIEQHITRQIRPVFPLS